jgi:ABC-type Fe2+-enterobactin transport system substrate-binding protein
VDYTRLDEVVASNGSHSKRNLMAGEDVKITLGGDVKSGELAIDKFEKKLQEMKAALDASQQELRETSQQTERLAQALTQAESAGSRVGGNRHATAVRELTETLSRGQGKLLEFSRGFDDFVAGFQVGGLPMALRATANNVNVLLASLNPLAAVVGTLALASLHRLKWLRRPGRL